MTRCGLARGEIAQDTDPTYLPILPDGPADDIHCPADTTAPRFNSYTQQLCVNDAVLKDNRTSATEKDLKPKLSPENNVSQQVSFMSKFVDHSSDVTEAMNISGSLEIKFQGIGVKGSGGE